MMAGAPMDNKKCSVCNIIKPFICFGKDKQKKDGLTSSCKACRKDYNQAQKEKKKVYNDSYYLNNKDKIKEAGKQYYSKHKEERKSYRLKHYNANKEKILSYHQNRKAERNKQVRERRRSDLKTKINSLISRSIGQSLSGNKNGYHWEGLVGYTLIELIKHLKTTIPKEYKWEDYMSGKVKLHIDHKIPKKAFNFKSYKCTDFKRCWALKNLQLLPAKENMSKGAKLEIPFQPSLSGV